MRTPTLIITPKTPGLLTRAELTEYLNVGINEVPVILNRFHLVPLENRFPLRSVWRQILKLEPTDAEEEALLMEQLQPLKWVASRIGRASSTLRAKLAKGTFEYPGPIADLGEPGTTSRSRRWLPAQIHAALYRDAVPVFRSVSPVVPDPDASVARRSGRPEKHETGASAEAIGNAFAHIAHSNARITRQ